MQEIQNPYPIFLGLDGLALELGYIYIGDENADPQTSPKAVFFDEAGTEPATQPIRTLAGYPDRAGSPARLFTSGEYSVRVRNSLGAQVFYEESMGAAEAIGSGQPYMVHFYWQGEMDVQKVVAKHVFSRAVHFDVDLPDLAWFHAGVAPDDDCIFSMRREGIQYGTLTIQATTGDLAIECDEQDFAVGERFELVSPDEATTIEDLAGTFEGETA